jgi:hypothetical protein
MSKLEEGAVLDCSRVITLEENCAELVSSVSLNLEAVCSVQCDETVRQKQVVNPMLAATGHVQEDSVVVFGVKKW